MAQRTLSRTVPTLLPTPVGSDGRGLTDGEAREGGASLRELDALLPTPNAWLGRRPENSMADPERARSREHDGKRGKRSFELPDALAAEVVVPKLLPTPTSAVDSGSRNLEGSKAHAGVSLTDVFVTGGSTEPRLLPTPQAADGDGGRQEKSAMGNAGVRPSGQKATLPLPTAVGMRDELTETPFARPAGDEQLALLPTPTSYVGDRVEGQLPTEVSMLPTPKRSDAKGADLARAENRTGARHSGDDLGAAVHLLPTPMANDENPGAGGELRAAIVHGEGRRNETGVDTLGRPNAGRPSRMLPTPAATDAKGSDLPRDGGASLREVDRLLPTPETANRKSRRAMTASTDNGRRSGGGNSSPPALEQIAEIREGRWPHDLPPYDELPPATREIVDSLLAEAAPTVEWGVYEGAVRRWEHVLGRDAPAPTDDKGRLDPPFVEWMLGYPPDWFDVAGVSRTRKLRALGNSVQVQCGEAVGHWLAALLESGLLEETA